MTEIPQAVPIPIRHSAPVAPVMAFPELTDREREVALLLAVGKTNKEIAAELGGISVKTVDTHRGHLMKRLQCRNNVELARLAIRLGYVTL